MAASWSLFVTGALAFAVVSLFESFYQTVLDPSPLRLSQSRGFGPASFRNQSHINGLNERGSVDTPIVPVTEEVSDNTDCAGKERLLSILRAAETKSEDACSVLRKQSLLRGSSRPPLIYTAAGKCDYTQICAHLPFWENVTELYGDKPVILGLDTCSRYREILSERNNNGTEMKPMVRVAGLYNAGTNALAAIFYRNLNGMDKSADYPAKHDSLNVPWGKHIAAKFRLINTFPEDRNESKDHVLPIVIVRDPYRWMNSMCKAPYSVFLDRRYNCPHLFNIGRNGAQNRTYRVVDRMDQASHLALYETYRSLAHMWTEWHQQYVNADFPRLIVRFEDVLFHLEELIHSIAQCAGLPSPESVSYQLAASKDHGEPANFVSAMSRYGTSEGRHGRMARESFEFSKTALDESLMTAFHYQYGEYSPSEPSSFLPSRAKNIVQ